MTTPFKASFCSLNAIGLNLARKRRQLFRWLHNYKFDVIFLQETYSTKEVETIWNNRFIKIEGYSVYYKKWHEAGVTKVEDIFLGNTFLPFNDFCDKYKIKTNFLKYYGLCHAVPQEWVDILKGKAVVPVEKSADQDKIPLDQISCKLATKFLVKNKFVAPAAERRMRNANLNEVTIQRIYSLPFKVTKDTRLSIFQFKIVHHILPTNATLHRDSLRENDKCHL